VKRRLERWSLAAAAVWTGLIALVTLIPYRMWLEREGRAAGAAAGGSAGESLISGASAVVGVYGLVLLLVALVSAWLAWRAGNGPDTFVPWWTGACAVGALLTRDVVGCLLFSVACAVFWARIRALRRIRGEARTAISTPS
jgi:cation transporter-like permease